MGETAAHTSEGLVRASIRALLDLLFPPTCWGCGRRGAFWCAACNSAVQAPPGPLCPHCGAPTRSHARLCSQCRHLRSDLRARSYALYRPPVSTAILHLKYRPNQPVATVMGSWLAALYRRTRWSANVVVPVPLAPDRLRQRGYNQAALISGALSSQTGLEHRPRALLRIRDTRSQVGLDHHERAENVRGAFAAEGGFDDEAVLLVDDLYTTGATLRACAEACRQAGAARVYGVTVARAYGRPQQTGTAQTTRRLDGNQAGFQHPEHGSE